MSQLDDFREQLRNARPVEEEKEQSKEEVRTSLAPKKVRRKKDVSSGHASVWLPKDAQRKAKLLMLWLDAEGLECPGSIGDLMTDALDVLIETKYPKAKKYVDL